ncbi:hypothetical protein EPI10_031533 [Gossypium australe]|uniref:Uncharacterized protein n=1 Tax=Gossypium australe TaxID=47621 RepID=A0A5B6X0E7_9ROSI|nr:hypothetical protein EPI10_031533 [Gossypium australe]
MYRSRTKENGLRSRESEGSRKNESERISESGVRLVCSLSVYGRSSKLLKAWGPSRIIITLLNLFWYF